MNVGEETVEWLYPDRPKIRRGGPPDAPASHRSYTRLEDILSGWVSGELRFEAGIPATPGGRL